eukprot:TRINITY_DN17602_c0_g1_i2.p1 TRINITY_DN17602_c0_g1~~TRINITY_DN17602_c0_g1_i2.p1  ORF type:complete len:822 (-),score=118.30 TRINITY_DN17602_c0_g1_i2:31-2475(-)
MDVIGRHVWKVGYADHLALLRECGEAPADVMKCLQMVDPQKARMIPIHRVKLENFLTSADKIAARRNACFVHELRNVDCFQSYTFVPLPHITAYLKHVANRTLLLAEVERIPEFTGDFVQQQAQQMLWLYTTNVIFELINAALRTREARSLIQWQDAIYLIDHALLAIPPTRGVFYRGVTSLSEPAKFTPGTELCFSSFTSASADREVALGFALRGAQPTLFEMHFIEARPLKTCSVFPGEQEVCAPTLSRWRVTGTKQCAGYCEVVLQQLPSTTLFQTNGPAVFPDNLRKVKYTAFTTLQGVFQASLVTDYANACPAGQYYADAVRSAGKTNQQTIKVAFKMAVAVADCVPPEHFAETHKLGLEHGFHTVITALHEFDDQFLRKYLSQSFRQALAEIEETVARKQGIDMRLVARLKKFIQGLTPTQRQCLVPSQGAASLGDNLLSISNRGTAEFLELLKLHRIRPGAFRGLSADASGFEIARSFSQEAPRIADRTEVSQSVQQAAKGHCTSGKCLSNGVGNFLTHLAKPVASCSIRGVVLTLRVLDVYCVAGMMAYQVWRESNALWAGEITWSQFKRNVVTSAGSIVFGTAGGIAGGCLLSSLAAAGSWGAVGLGIAGSLAGGIVVGMAAGCLVGWLAKKIWNPQEHEEETFNELRAYIEGATTAFGGKQQDLGIWRLNPNPAEGKYIKGEEYQAMKALYRRRVLRLHSDHLVDDTRTSEEKDRDTRDLAQAMGQMEIIRTYSDHLERALDGLGIARPLTAAEVAAVLPKIKAAAAPNKTLRGFKEMLTLHYDWHPRSLPKTLTPSSPLLQLK